MTSALAPIAKSELINVAPVLKWAGGKRQLLPELVARAKRALQIHDLDTYVEPFLGGGALFFELFKNEVFERWVLVDNNPELIVVYRAIQRDVVAVISELGKLSEAYLSFDDENRDALYYSVREEFNSALDNFDFFKYTRAWVERAAQMIFLNRTCFNGLFRVNRRGYFNVPTGRYKNPRILNEPRLRAASIALQAAELHLGDFADALCNATSRSFIYYDPPYRPISSTAAFTAYTASAFNDEEQARLAEVFREANRRGALQLLSNSDPTNYSPDPFFDDLYNGFVIERVEANRNINSNGSARGPIRELLIRNYE